MGQYVIEGTWEEIKLHEEEFVGHRLRVIVRSDKPKAPEASASANVTVPAKVLRGRGAFKGMTGGSEALAREKRAEIELEERNL